MASCASALLRMVTITSTALASAAAVAAAVAPALHNGSTLAAVRL